MSYKDLPTITITEQPPDSGVPACHVPLSTLRPHQTPPSCSPLQQNTLWQQQRQAARPLRIEGTQIADSRAQEQAGCRPAKKVQALAQRQKAVDKQQEQRRLQSLGERAALLERKRLQAMEDRRQQQRMEEQDRKAAMR